MEGWGPGRSLGAHIARDVSRGRDGCAVLRELKEDTRRVAAELAKEAGKIAMKRRRAIEWLDDDEDGSKE